jgi:hypothetical protein
VTSPGVGQATARAQLWTSGLVGLLTLTYALVARGPWVAPVAARAALVAVATVVLLLPSRLAPTGDEPWFRSASALRWALLALVAAVGSAARFAHVGMTLPVALVGVALTLWALPAAWRQAGCGRLTARQWSTAGLGWTLALAFFAGFGWGYGYASPRFGEAIVAGSAHGDTLFHAAIAQMIDSYGVGSTGLDGWPAAHYHTGSHGLFAGLASATGLAPLAFYQFGFLVLVAPLALLSLWEFVLALGRRQPALSTKPGFWLLAGAAFTGITWPFLARFAWVGPNLVVSESYALGTALLALLATLAVRHHQDQLSTPAATRTTLTLDLTLAAGVALLAAVKVSHFAVGLAGFGWLWLRLGRWRRAIGWLPPLLALGLGILATLKSTSAHSGNGWVPFAFLRIHVVRGDHWTNQAAEVLTFGLLHYAWTWLFVGLRLGQTVRLRSAGETRWQALRGALRTGAMVDVELAVVVALAASLPGLLIDIDGGGAYYFSDVQRWLGAALLLGALGRRVQEPQPTVWPRPVTGLLLVLLVFNGWQGGLRLSRVVTSPAPVHSERQDLLEALGRLRDLPRSTRAASVLWLPREVSAFWSGERLLATPMVGPALSGLALVDGVPLGDHTRAHYGYDSYPPRTSPWVTTPAQACARASQWGAQYLAVWQGQLRWLDVRSCQPAPPPQ